MLGCLRVSRAGLVVEVEMSGILEGEGWGKVGMEISWEGGDRKMIDGWLSIAKNGLRWFFSIKRKKSEARRQSKSTAAGGVGPIVFFFDAGFDPLPAPPAPPAPPPPPPNSILPIISISGFPCFGILIPKYISPILARASSQAPPVWSLSCSA
jgi:hypothetical protein